MCCVTPDAIRNEPLALDDTYPKQLLALLRRIEALKHLPRTGWLDREVAEPESVAAHSWRLAILAWLVAEAEGLNAAQAMRLALVHDIPEVITGDNTPYSDQAPTAEARRALATEASLDFVQWRNPTWRAQKASRERAAMTTILEEAPPAVARALQGVWEEYESGSSPEAQLVKQLDKLEAYLQGWEYARDGRLPQPETLNSFRADTEHQVQDPALRQILEALEDWIATGMADPRHTAPIGGCTSETTTIPPEGPAPLAER